MIISRGRRYIFVHIPKTGGTSLARALESRAMADDIMLGDTPKAVKRRHRVKGMTSAGRLWKHSTLRDIDGLVSGTEIAAFRVFTIVRNPWDRMVSYYHWLRDQRFEHVAVELAGRLEFAEFLRAPQIMRSFETADYASYVTVAGGVERCDLFLRLEHLAEDVAALEDMLGIKLPALTHDNSSDRRRDYRSYYADEDAEQVAQMCQSDIVRFGYSF